MASPIYGAGSTARAAGALTNVGATFDPDGAPGDSSFADTLKRALGEVSGLQETAQNSITSFLRGEDVEIHDVMAAAEEAGIALEMLIEVRNRVVEAYRTLTNMQG